MPGPVVILVGPMGAGKTTVGRLLALRRAVRFRDTDAEVEKAAGRSVAEIFAEEGEPAFRARERDAVASALRDHDGVLSLGGGAVLDPTTQAALAGRPVIFLRAGLEAVLARVGTGRGRPLLSGASFGTVRERAETLLAQRSAIYEQVAAHIVDTDGRRPDQIVEQIEELLP